MQLGRRRPAAAWYPRGVSTAERRLRYYAERFDTVEVDSTYYALPDPEVAGRWALAAPTGVHVQREGVRRMTHHGDARPDEAVRGFSGALEPLELSGKWRGVLSSTTHGSRRHGRDRRARGLPELLAPLVPLVEFRHRSWLEGTRRRHVAFLADHGLAFVSVDAPRHSATNVVPRVAAATHRVAYVRFHGRNAKTWNIRGARSAADRFDWQYAPEELAEWVEPVRGSPRRPTRSTPCSTTTATLRTAQRRDLPRIARRGGDRGYGRDRASGDGADPVLTSSITRATAARTTSGRSRNT